MDATLLLLLLVLLVVAGLVLWRGTPFFRSIFEHSDRDVVLDEKVVTPPGDDPYEGNLTGAVRHAEEEGTLDDEGFTRR